MQPSERKKKKKNLRLTICTLLFSFFPAQRWTMRWTGPLFFSASGLGPRLVMQLRCFALAIRVLTQSLTQPASVGQRWFFLGPEGKERARKGTGRQDP
jgi:hypothetical protein